jgi:hypothetical protein
MPMTLPQANSLRINTDDMAQMLPDWANFVVGTLTFIVTTAGFLIKISPRRGRRFVFGQLGFLPQGNILPLYHYPRRRSFW